MYFMGALIRTMKRLLSWSIDQTVAASALNIRLWRTTFWDTWGPLPLDAKLAWIAFVSQTIAVITLIELFLLKN